MYSNRRWISKLMLIALAVLALPPLASGQSKRVVFAQRSLAPAAAPDEARDLFNAGQNFYDEDKFAEAEKKFREVLSKFPKNAIADKADYYLIRTLSQQGKKNDALTRINAFTRQYPKSKWLQDVQEWSMRLTNQVPANAEYLLLPQPAAGVAAAYLTAAAKAAQAAATSQVAPSVHVIGPSPFTMPPIPPMPPMPPMPFGPIEFQSSDPQVSLQQEIMRAMFNNNADRAIEIATERLKTDSADPVVLSILNMVASSRSTQGLPMLLAIVKNSTNSKARKDAIFWLGQSRGDKDAIVDTLVGLIPSLADEDTESVTFTLGQIRSEKSLNALATIARDKSKSEKIRSGALFTIGQSRAPNRIALLEDIYKSNMDSSKIRQQVLFTLGQTHDPQVVTILGNIASTDPDIEVRKQAVFSLGQIRSPEANQALEKLLQKK